MTNGNQLHDITVVIASTEKTDEGYTYAAQTICKYEFDGNRSDLLTLLQLIGELDQMVDGPDFFGSIGSFTNK